VTEEDSDFSIATSSSNNDYEWQFTKDGVFKLPGSGSVGMVFNTPYYTIPEALQITSPSGFLLKSEENGVYWRLEANGNTVFPADVGIVGDLSNVRNIEATGIIKGSTFQIGNENILDKFITDNITLNSSQLGIYSVNATYNFTLSTTPRSLSAVAMYFNGSRVNPDRYSLDGRDIRYTKPENESAPIAVTVQFDYIKN
jgi:hypothetical protein